MSDPISSHSKPLSDTPIAATPTQLPPPAGQFQQFTAQPLRSTNQQMPDPASAPGNDDSTQGRLQERDIRSPIRDEFLSHQKSMIKTSTERLKESQRMLEAHKNRFLALSIGGVGALTSQKAAVASVSESVPDANIHDSKRPESGASAQTVPASDETTATQTTVPAGLDDTGLSQETNDIGQQVNAPESETINVTAQDRSNNNDPDATVTTTSITTETIHDHPDAALTGDTPPIESTPRQGEMLPAAEPDSLSRAASQTSFTTAEQGSVSSTESSDYQMAATATVDPGAPASTVRSRQVSIFYGDKNKVYCQVAMAEGSGLDKFEERIAAEIDNFRNKKRKAKNRNMTVQVGSHYQQDGEEKLPIYICHVDPPAKRHQIRTPAAAIAREITGILANEEKKTDADQLEGSQIRRDETRDDLTRDALPREDKDKID